MGRDTTFRRGGCETTRVRKRSMRRSVAAIFLKGDHRFLNNLIMFGDGRASTSVTNNREVDRSERKHANIRL